MFVRVFYSKTHHFLVPMTNSFTQKESGNDKKKAPQVQQLLAEPSTYKSLYIFHLVIKGNNTGMPESFHVCSQS